MKRLLRTALCCCLLPLAGTVHAENDVRYVRDWITVPLHEGQSASSAVVYPGVKSGTELTVVQPDPGSGFTRVRTSSGVEGWIATTYLMAHPTASMELDKANAELAKLQKANTLLKQEQANIPADKKLAAEQLTKLRNDNTQLHKQLQILQHAPDNATQLAEDNIDLRKNNKKLLERVATTDKQLAELRSAQNYTMFREGAFAVFAGAILTVLIPRLKPKKRSEWA